MAVSKGRPSVRSVKSGKTYNTGSVKMPAILPKVALPRYIVTPIKRGK